MEDYYLSQLSRIKNTGKFGESPRIQLKDSNNQTKWINVNKDSARALIDWLNKNILEG